MDLLLLIDKQEAAEEEAAIGPNDSQRKSKRGTDGAEEFLMPALPSGASVIQQRRNSVIAFDCHTGMWFVWFTSKNAPHVPLGRYDSLQECLNMILLFKRSKKFIRVTQPLPVMKRCQSNPEQHNNKKKRKESSSGSSSDEAPAPLKRSRSATTSMPPPEDRAVYRSHHRCVRWLQATEKWHVQICEGSIRRDLGSYETEEEAARAYNAHAILIRGAKTKTLNKVPDTTQTFYPPGYKQMFDGLCEDELELMDKIDMYQSMDDLIESVQNTNLSGEFENGGA